MFVIASPVQEIFSIAEFYQSELLNFAVWTLRQDGLRVEGFNAHTAASEQQSELKAFGFDAEEWKTWVNRIALSEYAQNLSMKHIYPYNDSAVCRLPLVLDGIAVEGQEGYRLCDRPLSDLSKRFSFIPQHHNPLAFIEGDSRVRLHLQVMWEQYRQRASNRMYFRDDLNRLIVKDPSIATKMNAAMQQGLSTKQKVLGYCFVDYPYEPTFYISDSTIILGISNPISMDEVLALLERSTRAIV